MSDRIFSKEILDKAIERSKKLFNEGRVLIINDKEGILCESCKYRGKSVHYLQQCQYCFNDGYKRFSL